MADEKHLEKGKKRAARTLEAARQKATSGFEKDYTDMAVLEASDPEQWLASETNLEESEKLFSEREKFFSDWHNIRSYLTSSSEVVGSKTFKRNLTLQRLEETEPDDWTQFIDRPKILTEVKQSLKKRLAEGKVRAPRSFRRPGHKSNNDNGLELLIELQSRAVETTMIDQLKKLKEKREQTRLHGSSEKTTDGNSPSYATEVRDMMKYRFEEVVAAEKNLQKFDRDLNEIEFKIYYAAGQLPALVGAYQAEYKIKRQELTDYLLANPEAYVLTAYEKMMTMKQAFDDRGKIVETPYVQEKMTEILSIVQEGRPAFIHGELGSGKSEVAKHLCRKVLSQPHVDRWLIDHHDPSVEVKQAREAWKQDWQVAIKNLEHAAKENTNSRTKLIKMLQAFKHRSPEDYVDENIRFNDDGTVEISESAWRNNPFVNSDKVTPPVNNGYIDLAQAVFKAKFKEWLENNPEPKVDKESYDRWEVALEEQREPIIVSGHKGLETDTFFGGIKVEKVEEMNPEEAEAWKNSRMAAFREKHKDLNAKELAERVENYDYFIDTYLDKPVETRGYLGKLYRAMADGRPLIIDEMNAIPHHVLVALNDYLTLRPGDTVTPIVDELPPFKVKEGFVVIGTGNWRPDDTDFFVGRQKLDPAFLSRFGLVSYDYLPNGRDFGSMVSTPDMSPEQLEAQNQARQGNELYQMMIVRLINRYGGLELPEGSADQIMKLTVVARLIQDVNSGMMSGDMSVYKMIGANTETNPEELLQENVLSLRHLIPIIQEWKEEGFRRSLDDYVFMHYVARSKARPEEMLYLYQLLQIQGQFFPTDKGWPDSRNADSHKSIVGYNIVRKMYGVDSLTGRKDVKAIVEDGRPANAFMSSLQVIEKLFGKVPVRKEIRLPKDKPEVAPVEAPKKHRSPMEQLELDRVRKALAKSVSRFEEIPPDKRLEASGQLSGFIGQFADKYVTVYPPTDTALATDTKTDTEAA